MEKVGPLQFIQQVRAEAMKVVWPSRKETVITSVMVIFMAVLASIVFLLADQVFSWTIAKILGVTH